MPKTMTVVSIGQVTADDPAVLLFSGTLDGLILKCPSVNTNDVWILDSATGDDSDGFPLSPGEAIVVDQYTTGTLYAYSTTSDVVCYMGGS